MSLCFLPSNSLLSNGVNFGGNDDCNSVRISFSNSLFCIVSSGTGVACKLVRKNNLFQTNLNYAKDMLLDFLYYKVFTLLMMVKITVGIMTIDYVIKILKVWIILYSRLCCTRVRLGVAFVLVKWFCSHRLFYCYQIIHWIRFTRSAT